MTTRNKNNYNDNNNTELKYIIDVRGGLHYG